MRGNDQAVHKWADTEIPRRLPAERMGSTPVSWRSRSARACSRRWAGPWPRRATPPPRSTTSSAGPASPRAFYEHFRDKEDCFLAAYEAAADELFARVREAQSGPDSGSSARARASRPTCAGSAAEPALARVFLIEVAAAGPRRPSAARRCATRYAEQLAELQREARRELPELSGRRWRSSTRSSRRWTISWSGASARPAVKTSASSSRSCFSSRWRCSPDRGSPRSSSNQSIVSTALPRTRRSSSASSAAAASRQLDTRSTWVSSRPAATSPAMAWHARSRPHRDPARRRRHHPSTPAAGCG